MERFEEWKRIRSGGKERASLSGGRGDSNNFTSRAVWRNNVVVVSIALHKVKNSK